MCGIAGIVNYDFAEPIAGEQLKALTDAMRFRGPDDEGFYTDRGVGLGMRRLSIIDLAGGHQPIGNEDGTCWVVMNGEIYNYIELRSVLERRGHRFQTSSDTEVIVHAYEEKGRACVEDFNGMFSFALYDRKRRGVWLVRDRLGIKPLFYAQTPQRLIFASDLQALVRQMAGAEVDPHAFIDFLGHGYIPTPNTIYRGVYKLPPAHWLWVEPRRMRMEPYWHLPTPTYGEVRAEEAIERLEYLLDDAVRLQLQSDVPVGVMLSGGMDSSALVAFAAPRTNIPLNTFTVAYDRKRGDDAVYSAVVATRYRTNHRQLVLDPASLLVNLDEILDTLDEPVSDSAIVPTFLIAKMARQYGVRVLLCGAGGDELFGGYARHHRPRIGSPAWVAGLPTGVRLVAGRAWAMVDPTRGWRAIDPSVSFGAGISGVDIGLCRQLFTDRAHFDRLLGGFRQSFNSVTTGNADDAYVRMRLDLHRYLVDDILALNDKGTMLASVEGRVPLLDHRIVEYVFTIPSRVNLMGSTPKGLFRHALQRRLPAAVLQRSKEGFNAPMEVWMAHTFAQHMREELLERPTAIIRELVDRTTLTRAFVQLRHHPSAAETIFSLYVFNRWHRTHGAT